MVSLLCMHNYKLEVDHLISAFPLASARSRGMLVLGGNSKLNSSDGSFNELFLAMINSILKFEVIIPRMALKDVPFLLKR